MILAGDIGGTNIRLAIFTGEGGALRLLAEATYPTTAHSGLEKIVADFVKANNFPITHAGIGVAGPVREGRSQAVNLPWVVDAAQLARELNIHSVVLLNDLEVLAHGLATLAADDFAVLQAGDPQARGNAAVIAPGTGLGEAGLYWDGLRHMPFATEGGHTSFAPSDELEDELLRYLRPQFQHVSWERVLSGPGLFQIYKFFRDEKGGLEPLWLAEEIKHGDPSALISKAALDGKSELCSRTLDLFVKLLGAEAGNLALKFMARGGVYLGGGIPPKILPKLREPVFLAAFSGKGRMREILESIPVRVILNSETALRGAANSAILRDQLPSRGNERVE
jgi:glucokinase